MIKIGLLCKCDGNLGIIIHTDEDSDIYYFKLNGSIKYCSIEDVKMLDITQIPNSQSTVKGVVNLRGSVIPVISLRSKLNFEDVEYNKDTRIIVVK